MVTTAVQTPLLAGHGAGPENSTDRSQRDASGHRAQPRPGSAGGLGPALRTYHGDVLARRGELQGRDEVCDVLPNHLLSRCKAMQVREEPVAGRHGALGGKAGVEPCDPRFLRFSLNLTEPPCLPEEGKAVDAPAAPPLEVQGQREPPSECRLPPPARYSQTRVPPGTRGSPAHAGGSRTTHTTGTPAQALSAACVSATTQRAMYDFIQVLTPSCGGLGSYPTCIGEGTEAREADALPKCSYQEGSRAHPPDPKPSSCPKAPGDTTC